MALTFSRRAKRAIKNVPPDVHAVLRRRAAAAGQSLQEYLLALLTEEARQESLDEVLSRAGGRAGGSVPLSFAARTLRSQRDRRGSSSTRRAPRPRLQTTARTATGRAGGWNARRSPHRPWSISRSPRSCATPRWPDG